MLRSLLVGINIIGIALLGFFQKSEPEITHDLPSSMQPGDEQVVVFNIDKSDISGFAKFQIELSPGLTAEMIQSEGASFTFNNQTAKFIWMALPSGKNMQIQLRIMANADAIGLLEVKSRFSYIYANERKNVDVPIHIIAVGEEGEATTMTSGADEKSELRNLDAEAQVSRVITADGLNQWRVEVSIEKSTLEGFAKVEETVPSGFTVVDLKSSSAVFNVDNQTVKYIWYDIPDNDVVVVSYKMMPVIQMDNVEPSISGTFSFLKDEETVEVPILAQDLINGLMVAKSNKDTLEAEVAEVVDPLSESSETPIEGVSGESGSADAKAATTAAAAKEAEVEQSIRAAAEEANAAALAANEAVKQEAAKQEAEARAAQAAMAAKAAALAQAEKDAQEKEAQKAREAQAAKTTQDKSAMASAQKSPSDGNIVNVPAPERGIFYRVQIAAGKNNLNNAVFAKLYNFDEGFKLETASGLLKYTTGYHQVYKAARDDRERITAKYEKFKGPFVAAYNDGERITVQEALMVSSQKWVP